MIVSLGSSTTWPTAGQERLPGHLAEMWQKGMGHFAGVGAGQGRKISEKNAPREHHLLLPHSHPPEFIFFWEFIVL